MLTKEEQRNPSFANPDDPDDGDEDEDGNYFDMMTMGATMMMVGPIQENKKHPSCEVLSCIRGAQHLGPTKRCLLRGHCLALGKTAEQIPNL